MSPLVDLVVEEPAWLEALPDLEVVAETAAAAALRGADIPVEGREIALLACSDDRIAALNAEFRSSPRPTNVLSWPAEDLSPEAPGGRPAAPSEGDGFLGDLAIALGVTQGEADAAGRPLKDHTLHLILHGCLHLLGFDHETEADATLMEGIEREELAALGLPDPYEEGEAGSARD